MSTLRLAVLRKAEPAFLCSFQKSPSALMMPFPMTLMSDYAMRRGGGRGHRVSLTKQIPRPPLHKLALGEQPLVLEDEVEVARVVDEHAWRQRGHAQGDRLVAELALALVEPAEELPAGLQELDAVADQREGVRGVPGEVSGGSDLRGLRFHTSKASRSV